MHNRNDSHVEDARQNGQLSADIKNTYTFNSPSSDKKVRGLIVYFQMFPEYITCYFI